MHPTRLSRPTVLLACLTGACSGPATIVRNPAGHRVFVDGAAVAEPELPFRYYGTGRWSALPADREHDEPNWSLQVAGGTIDQPAPASPWLFPLDFPIEVVRRALLGREDVAADIVLPAVPADQRIEAEVPPTGQSDLDARARRARIRR
ncbi:MAG: hypothetical protein JNK78_09920 [Planctomycetes bacterium]|nr:hypothetical protein [Planctomycetota bacterium]